MKNEAKLLFTLRKREKFMTSDEVGYLYAYKGNNRLDPWTYWAGKTWWEALFGGKLPEAEGLYGEMTITKCAERQATAHVRGRIYSRLSFPVEVRPKISGMEQRLWCDAVCSQLWGDDLPAHGKWTPVRVDFEYEEVSDGRLPHYRKLRSPHNL